MKERLTGAIILVVLIVLLVPELLSGPAGSSATASHPATGSSEEPPLKSYTINLGDDSRTHATANGGNGPAMPQLNAPEQSGTQNGAVVGQQNGAMAAPAEQGASQPAQGGGDSQANSSVAASGTTTSPPPSGSSPSTTSPGSTTEPQAINQGQVTNHGTPHPVPSKAAQPSASKSHTATRTASAGNSKQQTNSGAAAKSANAGASTSAAKAEGSASKAEGGWAVQLGLFRSRENAEHLALEARVKGFKVTVSPVSSGGEKRYRVRVGPAPDRAAAQELQGRLKASGRPGGILVPVP